MTKTIPELSIDTKLVSQRLMEAKIGDVIAYSELSEIIGRDITKEARYVLKSATDRLLNENMVFACVRGEGIKRLNDSEIIGVGEAALPHMRRTAKRASKKLSKVQDFQALTNEEKIRHNTLVSMFGALAHVSQQSQVKKLEGFVGAQSTLPLAKTLEAFR